MSISAVPVRIFLGCLLLSSIPVFAADVNEVLRDATCGASGSTSREGFCNSIKSTWSAVKGDNTARACTDRKSDVSACCNGGNINNASCKAALIANSGGSSAAIDAILKVQPNEALPPPLGANAGPHDTMVHQKNTYLAGVNANDRVAGICKALAGTCTAKCSSDPAGVSGCDQGDSISANLKAAADQSMLKANAIDPSQSQQQPGGGSGTAGGGNQQSGNNPGQAPTQKNKSSGGPMQQVAQALTQALGAMANQQQQQDTNPESQNFQSETCEQNSNLAGCASKAEAESDSWNRKQPTAEIESASVDSSNAGDINVANSSGTQPTYNGNGEQQFGTPAAANGVPNGGGQMLGQGGSSGAAGSGQTTGGFGIASKAATDIMHGMMSGGGYSQMNAAMQLQNGGNGGGFSGYGQPSGEFRPGMDLRQFLPGGKADPTRKIAGGASTFQIQPQTVNIWSRISERFRARCNQGLLRDCN